MLNVAHISSPIQLSAFIACSENFHHLNGLQGVGMSDMAEATKKIVDVLMAFSTEQRLRVVKASLTLLGDELGHSSIDKSKNVSEKNNENVIFEDDNSDAMPVLAKQWMKKNGVSMGDVEHYYHFDGGKVVTLEIPGLATTKKDQSVNAYLAVGLASLLEKGDPSFSDSDARAFCEKSGCYDMPNHSKIIKSFGNKITGSKNSGWKLTTPGLSAVAELIKQPRG